MSPGEIRVSPLNSRHVSLDGERVESRHGNDDDLAGGVAPLHVVASTGQVSRSRHAQERGGRLAIGPPLLAVIDSPLMSGQVTQVRHLCAGRALNA